MRNNEIQPYIETRKASTGLITSSDKGVGVFGGEIILDPVEQYKLRLGSTNSARTLETRINECAKIWGCEDRTQIIWDKLTKAHIQGLIKTMEHQGKSLSTIKNTLSLLKGTIREAYDLDMISMNNFQKILNVRPPKGSQEDKGVSLDIYQIKEIFHKLSNINNSIGIRDNAIMHILLSTGLRRIEIVKIKMEDIDFSNKVILIKGKGNKERKVGLNVNTFMSIKKYIENVRGDEEGFLFTRIRKNGKMKVDNHLSDQAIYNIVKDRCKMIGITKIAAHDMRRTFATYMIEKGIDILNVSKMMGHSSPETTKRYDKSGQNKALDIMKNSDF